MPGQSQQQIKTGDRTLASKRILIVEDDEDIASALARAMTREGYLTTLAYDRSSALTAIGTGCDGAIIDAMLGEDRGEDIVRHLRKSGHDIPIIMLSALSGVEDRARGLEAGADDYVAKPFELAELIARLKVQENRRSAARTPMLRIDENTRRVTGAGRSVSLTERELDLLRFLVDRQGELLSRGEIFDALWLGEGSSSENVVDVYLGYLRRKLSPPEAFGVEIKTMRGRGFVLEKQEKL